MPKLVFSDIFGLFKIFFFFFFKMPKLALNDPRYGVKQRHTTDLARKYSIKEAVGQIVSAQARGNVFEQHGHAATLELLVSEPAGLEGDVIAP
jgi:hypothetical protein